MWKDVKGMIFFLNVFARFHFTTTLGNDLIWQALFFFEMGGEKPLSTNYSEDRQSPKECSLPTDHL